ncbi:MAG: phage terminase large subunit [Rikenellaceae bacterium]
MMGKNEILIQITLENLRYKKRRQSDFAAFSTAVYPTLELTDFHRSYYGVLEAFAKGKIRKLIVTVPPQHGKSTASSQLLPAYMLGLNPDLRIGIASYGHSLASKFNKRVQQVIESAEYQRIFDHTRLATARDTLRGRYIKTSGEFDVVGHSGSLLSVGRGGALTGNRVDCMILDDLYKDSAEGNSPVIRDSCLEWYISVVKTRLHKSSQELIVFTRWHEEDLIGTIESREEVRLITDIEQIDESYKGFYKLNFEAIKESDPTPIDPRGEGEVLWESMQDYALLSAKRAYNPHVFECMYQGAPSSREGLLYGDNFKTYTDLPDDNNIVALLNYTDTADMGEDYLCSICYVKTKDKRLYVTDIVFTQKPMEETEPMVAQMLKRNGTRVARIESNNGGRGFARAVKKLSHPTKVETFNQGANKESRILTNSATVLESVIFPFDWATRWGEFYLSITRYKRLYKANRWHDAADVITGMAEELVARGKIKTFF